MKKNNSVIIFDFDGTIADTLHYVRNIVNQLSDEFGFKKLKEEELEKLRGEKSKEAFKKIGIPLTKIPSFLKRVRLVFTRKFKDVKPVEGVREALNSLKKEGYELGIVTSSPKKNVEMFLNNNDLNLFDFIYSEGDIFNKDKPMNAFLKKRKLDPEQVFYVGDETRDIEAARKTGVRTIAVSWGFNNEEILSKEGPDYLIKEPKELIKIFTQ